MLDWFWVTLNTLLNWIRSIIQMLLSFIKSLPSLINLSTDFNIFIPAFVLSFFTLNIALGVVLFIINRK